MNSETMAEQPLQVSALGSARALVPLFVVLYTLAALVTTVLHEVAHATTSAFFGGQPVLHHVYVMHYHATGARAPWTTAAGPLFSLLQGLVLMSLWPRLAWLRPAARLFLLWLGLDGCMNFFGYLLTTPFVPGADLGELAIRLDWSAAQRWLVAGVGLGGMLAVGALAAPPLLRFAPAPESLGDAGGRSRAILAVAIVPWMVGGLLMAALSIPASHWLVYAYDVLGGCFLIGTWRRAARLAPPSLPPSRAPWLDARLWPWALALGVLAGVFVFVLRPGVQFGW